MEALGGSPADLEASVRKFLLLVDRARSRDAPWFSQGGNLERSLEVAEGLEQAAAAVEPWRRQRVDEGLLELSSRKGVRWPLRLERLLRAKGVVIRELLGNVTSEWHRSTLFAKALREFASAADGHVAGGGGEDWAARAPMMRRRAGEIFVEGARRRATASTQLRACGLVHRQCPPLSDDEYPSRPGTIGRRAFARLLRGSLLAEDGNASIQKLMTHARASPEDMAETVMWLLVLPPIGDEEALMREGALMQGPQSERPRWERVSSQLTGFLLDGDALPCAVSCQHPWLLSRVSVQCPPFCDIYMRNLESCLRVGMQDLLMLPGGTALPMMSHAWKPVVGVCTALAHCILASVQTLGAADAVLSDAIRSTPDPLKRCLWLAARQCVLDLCSGDEERHSRALVSTCLHQFGHGRERGSAG